MNFIVLYSKKDEAGVSITEELKKYYLPQIPVIELQKDTIFSEDIDKDERIRNFDFIIFASRHKSAKGGKTLSIHAPGNWRNADFGGKAGKICPTNALVIKYLFQKLKENAEKEKSDYEITLECTHHGPLIEKPCCFIELGAGEEQWKDKKTAAIIAKTISDLQNFESWKDENKKQLIPTFLIGGGHYSPAGNKVMLETNYAIGHIFPKYCLPLNESMLNEGINKTKEYIDEILLDWKGLGAYKKETIELLDRMRLKYKRVQNIS